MTMDAENTIPDDKTNEEIKSLEVAEVTEAAEPVEPAKPVKTAEIAKPAEPAKTVITGRGRKEKPDKRAEIIARIDADPEFTKKPLWKFIEDLNSVDDAHLDRDALIDASRRYTFRQMFRAWRRYAAAFSALGITGENSSRVCLLGTTATESILAMYALNMTGAVVSNVAFADIFSDQWKKIIKSEKLTDMVIADILVNPKTIRDIIKEKDTLGIRNIILLHSPKIEPFEGKLLGVYNDVNYLILKKTPGVSCMDDLLETYEDAPISYGAYADDEVGLILHSSGTTKGIHKPIPFTNDAINNAAYNVIRGDFITVVPEKPVTMISIDPSFVFGIVDMVHSMLAFGVTLVTSFMGALSPNEEEYIKQYNVNLLFGDSVSVEKWMLLPEEKQIDFENVEYVVIGGFYISPEKKKQYNEYLKTHGSKVRITNGYGMSETAGACIVAPPEREDDTIGFPLPGVSVKLWDEGNDIFYDIDGEEHSGVMMLASKSLTTGEMNGELLAEFKEIDGVKYINTHDLGTCHKDGSISYEGRTDRFFLNEEGVKFNAGLIEKAFSDQLGIEGCAMVPLYIKTMQDNIPLLYVRVADTVKDKEEATRQALYNVFIGYKLVDENNLPSRCVIVDKLPKNSNGKIDVFAIGKMALVGDAYIIKRESKDGKLIGISLMPISEQEVLSIEDAPDGTNPLAMQMKFINDRARKAMGKAKKAASTINNIGGYTMNNAANIPGFQMISIPVVVFPGMLPYSVNYMGEDEKVKAPFEIRMVQIPVPAMPQNPFPFPFPGFQMVQIPVPAMPRSTFRANSRNHDNHHFTRCQVLISQG